MVTRSSTNASMSSRNTSLGVPNFLALAWNLVRVLSDTLTVKYADLLMGIMMETFFAVDVESVSHLCHNTTHATKFFSKKKPRGLVNPGATL